MDAQSIIQQAHKANVRKDELFALFYPEKATQQAADRNLTKVLGGKYGRQKPVR